MKKIYSAILVLGFIAVAGLNPACAQMGEAQKVNWEVTKQATVKADLPTVWKLISNLKDIQLYANEFITSVEIKGTSLPFERILTFADGTKRTEQINQVEPEPKLIAYEIKGSALPQGLKGVTILLIAKAKDEQTEVSWQAMIEGANEAKKAFKEQLSAEFEKYATGLTNFFNKSIPATKMN